MAATDLAAQALAQAHAQTLAAQQPLLDQITAQDAQTAAHGQAIQGFATALATLLSGAAPTVQNAYTDAGNQLGALAKGFSGGFQANVDQNQQASNDFLAKMGAPSGALTSAPNVGDLGYGIGGYIPASSIGREGAAYTAAAAQLPGIAAAKGQQDLLANTYAGQSADATIRSQIAELAAKEPGIAQTVLQQLEDLQLRAQTLQEQTTHNRATEANAAASAKATAAYRSAELAQGNQRIKDTEANQAFNQRATATRLNLDANKFAQQTLNQNRAYAVSLANLGIRQKSLQLRVAAQEFKLQNGGFTPSQLTHFGSILQSGINEIQTRVDPATGATQYVIPDPKDKTGKKLVPITYADYVKQAVGHGAPLSLAIDRANSFFPETQRPTPQDLGSALGISTKAAAGLTGAAQTKADYNATVGLPKNGKVPLATGPNGQTVNLQMPKNVTPAIRTVISGAVEYLGTPYAWGGESPSGFDCSGLAQYLYGKAGVQIPRTTYDQFQSGTAVPKGQLQAGDLVFFKGSDSKTVAGRTLPGHVGIYVGGGQFIEAPKTGDVVKVSRLAGRGDYMGARRFAASGGNGG